jgi:hypothetical protein
MYSTHFCVINYYSTLFLLVTIHYTFLLLSSLLFSYINSSITFHRWKKEIHFVTHTHTETESEGEREDLFNFNGVSFNL